MSNRKRSSGTLGRIGPLRPSAPSKATDAGVDPGDGPPSDVWPVEAREQGDAATSLVVATPLSGAAAAAAWITITRAGGIICFEGPLGDDGRIAIPLGVVAPGSRVCVRLETLRWHRQAEVALAPGENVYAFS
jgi:hypothetical protein